MNKRVRLLVMFSITLLLALSLATANKNSVDQINRKNNSHHHDKNDSSNDTKLNYGLCVSNYSHIQQDCFAQAKNNQSICLSQGILSLLENYSNQYNNQTNSTTNSSNLSKSEQRRILRQFRSEVMNIKQTCKEQYKQEKNQCKEDFKNNKLQCIQFRCKSSQVFSNETNKCVPKAINTTENNNTLQVKEFAFLPSESTIKLGENVTWTNTGTMNHTVTSDSGAELNSPQLAPGENYTHMFNTTGTFEYHCANHPSLMKGKIIVQ